MHAQRPDGVEFAVYEYAPVDEHFIYRDTATNNLLVYSVGHKSGQ